NEQSKAVRGSRMLVLGVAYKKNIDDIRESPALDVIRLLRRHGALVEYHDPHVPKLKDDDLELKSVPLTPEALSGADCVLIVTITPTWTTSSWRVTPGSWWTRGTRSPAGGARAHERRRRRDGVCGAGGGRLSRRDRQRRDLRRRRRAQDRTAAPEPPTDLRAGARAARDAQPPLPPPP